MARRSRDTIGAVVIGRNEGKRLRSTVDQLDSTLPAGSEIVVVDDGSTDGSAEFLKRRRKTACNQRLIRSRNLGVAKARNLGWTNTNADTVIFTDAHLNFPRRWWQTMTELVEDPSVGAAAPGISMMGETARRGFGLNLRTPELSAEWLDMANREPHAVPVLPGACMAVRRRVLELTGGPDSGMLRCGGVDNEFCLRLWLLGYRLMIVPDVVVEHLFARRGYPITWPTIMHNRLRMAFIHFDRPRIRRVIRALRGASGFVDGLSLLAGTDISEQRARMRERRLHHEDWFFEKFGHNW